jgi:hypothetical protein
MSINLQFPAKFNIYLIKYVIRCIKITVMNLKTSFGVHNLRFAG